MRVEIFVMIVASVVLALNVIVVVEVVNFQVEVLVPLRVDMTRHDRQPPYTSRDMMRDEIMTK